jgi:hypothetical protein
MNIFSSTDGSSFVTHKSYTFLDSSMVHNYC